jgi:hypothetical protein
MSTAELEEVVMNEPDNNEPADMRLDYVMEEPELRYRAMSGLAVFSLVIAVLSLPSLVLPGAIGVLFMAGSFLAAVLGFISIRAIKQRPDELLGTSVGWCGAIIGAATLVISIGWNAYVTATEVPEGYTRVSFRELAPNNRDRDLPVSKKALELDGKRVYIKGYTAPGTQRVGLKEFTLVRDIGDCCFGGQPEPTHMMNVKFMNGLSVNYGYSLRGVGGILRVEKQPRLGDLGGSYFRLEADHVR